MSETHPGDIVKITNDLDGCFILGDTVEIGSGVQIKNSTISSANSTHIDGNVAITDTVFQSQKDLIVDDSSSITRGYIGARNLIAQNDNIDLAEIVVDTLCIKNTSSFIGTKLTFNNTNLTQADLTNAGAISIHALNFNVPC